MKKRQRHQSKSTMQASNVIYLQLESFFDITDLNDVTVNEDPIPNYHRLFDTCSSGFLSVPSVGAGTAKHRV